MTYELYLFDQKNSLSLTEKLQLLPYSVLLLICLVATTGAGMLYSAAGGNIEPWAHQHVIRFFIGFVLMIGLALIDIRIILRYAYVIYGLSVVSLLAVEVFGEVNKGAQRWLDIGFMQLQPSEFAKIAVVLALARVLHSASYEDIGRIRFLAFPLLLVAIPSALIVKQPDLGTTVLLLLVSSAVLFVAGLRMWKVVGALIALVAAVPIGWQFLREYQKNRVMTWLDPDLDPLGAGYHINQSKIAFGSGGLFGKGFLNGSQSHLNYLPEKQTDFIFAMLAEEWGLIGAAVLIFIYSVLLAYGYYVALSSRNQFGRILAIGMTVNLFLYIFANIAMVTGIIPVKGAPLPLVSYGGSAMLAVMVGFGLLINVAIHRETKIARNMMPGADRA